MIKKYRLFSIIVTLFAILLFSFVPAYLQAEFKETNDDQEQNEEQKDESSDNQEQNEENILTIKFNSPKIRELIELELIKRDKEKKEKYLSGEEITIKPDDLDEFNTLILYERDLTNDDIKDLKYFNELKTLYLSGNKISNISPLQNLSKLRNLYIENNQIKDISPLKELQQLETLQCWNNQIEDISPLKNLKRLKSLYLSSNNIKNIDVFKNETNNKYNFNIKTLFIDNNEIENISPLKNLQNLKKVNMEENKIDFTKKENKNTIHLLKKREISYYFRKGNHFGEKVTFSDYKNNDKLDKLIRNLLNKPEDEPIYDVDIASIDRLDLSKFGIEDFDFIERFYNLRVLILDNNNINEISVLSKLENLTHLYLSNNNINEISILSKLENLTHLYLSNNNIQYSVDKPSNFIEVFKNLINLKVLYLDGNYIKDLDFLNKYIESLPKNCLDIINIQYNDLNLREGTNNYKIVEKLLNMGICVKYKRGNIVTRTFTSSNN